MDSLCPHIVFILYGETLMAEKVVINWDEHKTISGQDFPSDKLERAKYASFLTKFLASQGFDSAREEGDRKRNYVLNLNSEWGSGKTYFLKRWAEDLKEHYPVVYVDAWEKDYSEDPLMTVVSAIIKDLREQAGREEEKFAAPTKLIGLLKAAAPGIARGVSKRFLGIDPVAIMEADDAENGSVVPIVDKEQNIDISFAAAEVVNHLIKEHEAKGEAINNLKKNVSEWVEAVKALKGVSLPAFIFIDELDRCRPSYAVEMLETIKHIFDIPGVVFVVATDTEQLQHAVKAVYGEGFDARIYLGRFFNSRFSLKAPELESFLDVHSDSYKLSESYLRDFEINLLPFNQDGKETLRNISVVLNAFQVSARTAIQIADRVIATISNMPQKSCVDILMLTTLHCLKEKDNELFEEVVSGRFKRVERIGDKTTTTYLGEFFESYLPIQDGIISMNFNPNTITKEFKASGLGNIQNQYQEGVYKFRFIDYLKEVFSEHFNSKQSHPYIGWGNGVTQNSPSTALENSSKKLAKHFSDYRFDSEMLVGSVASILWFEYFYQKKGYASIGMDEYQDLVELASAFDWMGKDELPPLD